MPLGLKRYQDEGDDHFITFSCYRREAHFTTSDSKDIFLHSLELTRHRYCFEVLGYVVMPEHVPLLVSEPVDHEVSLSKGGKIEVHASQSGKAWLVERPEEWRWSSYRHYLLDEPSPVEIARPF